MAEIPKQFYPDDAGFDLQTMHEVYIPPLDHALVNTGIAIALPDWLVAITCNKSSIMMKKLVVGQGVIDSGYRGEVRVVVYNLDRLQTLRFYPGEHIAQIMFIPFWSRRLKEVYELPPSKRGTKGFGSSRKAN